MTVQTNTNVANFLGNGAATYPIGFKFNSAADLVVQKTVIATGVTTTLTLNSDYSVAGAGIEEGGSITFNQAPASAESIKVTRVVDLLQLTDLRNQGKFYAEVHEEVFDKLVMIDQQQQTEINDANAKSDESVATANAANAKSDQAVAKAAQNLVDMQAQYDAFEQGAALVVIGDYSAGLVVDAYNKVFRKGGEFYRASAELELPYELTGNWGVEGALFVSVGDAVLRQELSSPDGAVKVGYGVETVGAALDRLLNSASAFVSPREFGAVAETDATSSIQAALDDPRPLLVIDEPYLHNPEIPLMVPSNKTIWFVGAGSITAIPCDSGSHRCLDITLKENVTIINPQVYGERAGHIGTAGESGFGIYILSSKDVRVFGGKMKDWWGDGIYIGAFNTSTHYNCERILIDNVECDNNRRQGMSITAAIGVTVRGGKFNNTNGTAPQSGIDIEPNAGFACRNIKLLAPEAKGNTGSGIMSVNVAEGGLADACKDIVIENPQVADNGFHGIRLIKSLSTTVRGGTVRDNTRSGVDLSGGCDDSTVEGVTSTGNGTYGIAALSSAGGRIKIKDNRVYNNSGHGIDTGSSASNCEVEGNDCKGNGLSGARTQGSSSIVRGNTLTNNGLVNTAAKNLEVSGASSVVTGNIVRSGGSGAVTGVAISGSGQSVIGNDFRSAGVTTNLANTSTSSVVRDNFPKVASSTTAGRPTLYLEVGDSVFDTTLNKLVTWNGSDWKDGSGATV